jgi:hypothetical protein
MFEYGKKMMTNNSINTTKANSHLYNKYIVPTQNQNIDIHGDMLWSYLISMVLCCGPI